MKKILSNLTVLLCCFAGAAIAQTNTNIPIYQKVYPQLEQILLGTDIFGGDRHGNFKGDYVAHLSDGSAWKIHPDNREKYAQWSVGDVVRIKLRTDLYWFKREHKFWLYNQTRDESVKVMIVQHKNNSNDLKIVYTETYAKSTEWSAVSQVVVDTTTGESETVIVYESVPSDFRKILGLSDGTFWVIKDKFKLFMLGKSIYIGAQGSSTDFYDFVLIVGDEREAEWALARPQK